MPEPIIVKEIEDLNKFLATFGMTPKGEAKFRVVFSDNITQVRFGEFNEFYGSVFVRTFKGFLERPKYPEIQERYILEQWYPPNIVFDPLIPSTKDGDYVCRYVFENRVHEANPISVIPPIAKIWMKKATEVAKSSMLIKSTIKQEHEDKTERNRKLDEDTIDVSPMQNALHMREGIGYTKEMKDK